MEIVYIGLGSNLNEPETQIKRAFLELANIPFCHLKKISSLYKSKALGPPQPDYINACAELETSLSPQALLDNLHAIEDRHERVREIRWGPRTLDLDILLFGKQTIKTKTLTIPHPELINRDFVLVPLFEINPHLILPDQRTDDRGRKTECC